MITKKELQHLAELARLEIKEADQEKLLRDLEKILGHFEELKEINTENVEPVSGGHDLKNVWREDGIKESRPNRHPAVDAFPETENGFLKIPPVFE